MQIHPNPRKNTPMEAVTLADVIRSHPDLPPMEARFVFHYVWGEADGEGKQAAILAGYSAKRADSQATNLIARDRVRDAIQHQREIYASSLECSRLDIMVELQRIAFANIQDYGEWLTDGTFILKDSTEIPRELASCIKEVTKVTTVSPSGNEVHTTRLTFYDKLSALKTLAQVKMMFPEKGAKESKAPPVKVAIQINQVTDRYAEALDAVVETVREIPPGGVPVVE